MTDNIKDPRGGRAWRKLRLMVLATSDRCWLCGKVRCEKGCCDRANTADHVLPFSTHPHLAMEPSNLKPAHRCCNSKRGDSPPDVATSLDPTTRVW